MKFMGLILVVLGALALAAQGFGFAAGDRAGDDKPVQMSADRGQNGWATPVVGGISLVGGLMMLATGTGRRLHFFKLSGYGGESFRPTDRL